jgi:hypothetical protein
MNWLIKIFFERLFEFVLGLINKEAAAARRIADQKKKDEENLQKYTDAIKSGAPDAEVEKRAEDVLNGD